jgi:hypothetical protein
LDPVRGKIIDHYTLRAKHTTSAYATVETIPRIGDSKKRNDMLKALVARMRHTMTSDLDLVDIPRLRKSHAGPKNRRNHFN